MKDLEPIPPSDSRIANPVVQAGAGALAVIVAVLVISTIINLAIGALITLAVVVAIGVVLWAVFLRGRRTR